MVEVSDLAMLLRMVFVFGYGISHPDRPEIRVSFRFCHGPCRWLTSRYRLVIVRVVSCLRPVIDPTDARSLYPCAAGEPRLCGLTGGVDHIRLTHVEFLDPFVLPVLRNCVEGIHRQTPSMSSS